MNPPEDDDKPPSSDELEAAARLAAALARDEIAEMLRAAAGHAAPLGELRARGLAREAVRSLPRQRRRPWPLVIAVVAVALLFIAIRLRTDPLPERLQARSAGLLVPGPFPATQTAAERLDLVTADRLITLREARCRARRRGAP